LKIIYLIRHAKSSWANVGQTDFDRPLNERYKMDAPIMGRGLLERKEIPDLVYCSTAKRARKTCKKIITEVGIPNSLIQFEEDLYHASYKDILNRIGETNNKHQSIYVIGHNPGLSVLASMLTDDSVEMVTCSIVKIKFDCDDWHEVFSNTGELVYHDYPKNI
jgi:phosphohistidine phosphatase